MLANWERNKQLEKKRTHLFEGIPVAMPALAKAAKAERKLASFGLGWDATGLDAGSLVAALAGLFRLSGHDGPVDEDTASALGALLLEQARLIAHRGGDPESLLRRALDRLGAKVAAVEAARGRGRHRSRRPRARAAPRTVAVLPVRRRRRLTARRGPSRRPRRRRSVRLPVRLRQVPRPSWPLC